MSNIMDDFKVEETERKTKIEPGDYRCVITSVEETTSKSSGKPMLVVSVRISDSNIVIKNYIVKNDYFNQNVTKILKAFGIELENRQPLSWVGHLGACHIDYEENSTFFKIKWWLDPEETTSLPPFVGDIPAIQTVTTIPSEEDESELPF